MRNTRPSAVPPLKLVRSRETGYAAACAKTGRLIMALWQFIVIAVLIGALLVYAGVLTNRIGSTNAALKRVEEALLITDRLLRHAAARAAEGPRSAEVSGKEGNTGYLTVRDLKKSSRARRSSRESSEAMSRESREAMKMRIALLSSSDDHRVNSDPVATGSEGRETLNASDEPMSSPNIGAVNGNSVPTSSQSLETLTAIDELLSLPDTLAPSAGPVEASVKEDPVATSPESGEALETNGEPPSTPAADAANEELVKKKNRDTLLFLSSQRRRRRARQGY